MEVNLVVFETSGSRCDVALLSQAGGAPQVWSQAHEGAAEHAQHVLPLLDGLLARAGKDRTALSAVAFGQGPGGFTGLRVACGLAQGLAFALDIPVIPVPSLLAVAASDQASLAPQARWPAWVVLQDARMEEVYAAVYACDADQPDAARQWRTLHAPVLLRADQVGQWLAQVRHDWIDASGAPVPLRAVGDALAAFPVLAELDLFDSVGAPIRPDAGTLARLALQAWQRDDTVPAELAAPWYVRDKVAFTTLEREQGAGGNPRAVGSTAGDGLPVVVPMTAEHLDQVFGIEQAVQAFPWTLGNFRDALDAGYGAWVAMQDGRVCGFCLVMFAPDVAHLLLIAVAQDSQRHGVGRLLLHHVQQQVRRRSLPALILEVRPSNLAAREFYRTLGFQDLSVRKQYYPAAQGKREDALVLWKPFTTDAESAEPAS